MLIKNEAIRIDLVDYGRSLRSGKLRKQKVYIFNCLDCTHEIRCQAQWLIKHSGKCKHCSQRSRPHEASYNELIKANKRKNREITITYEDFLKYTKIKNCYYCNNDIKWNPYSRDIKTGEYVSRSYNLDRKDNNKGYTKENCVVCCWVCNELKGTYSENEFIEICRKVARVHGL